MTEEGARSGHAGGERWAGWRAKAVLALVSLVAALAVGETGVRLLEPAEPSRRATQLDDVAVFITHHPQLGWVLEPGAQARQKSSEFDVAVEINRAGMRESIEYAPEPPPGVRRVLTLGDSFTFGHGVARQSSYPELLERQLEDTQVINLAVTGYGTDQQLLILRERGLSYHPDVVLVGLFVGDVFRNARRYQLVYPKPRFELADGGLVLANVPVPSVDASPPARFPLHSFALFASRARELWEHLGYGRAWTLTEHILRAMRDASGRAGATLLVAIIPKDRTIYGKGWRRRVHLRTLEKVRGLLERNGIRYVDTTPALAAWARDHPAQPVYYPRDGHWTAAGHRVAAEALLGPVQALLPESPPTKASE